MSCNKAKVYKKKSAESADRGRRSLTFVEIDDRRHCTLGSLAESSIHAPLFHRRWPIYRPLTSFVNIYYYFQAGNMTLLCNDVLFSNVINDKDRSPF